MVDRPILFSAPMVRALLDGRKTQTRRVLKAVVPDGMRPDICCYSPTSWGLREEGNGRCSCRPIKVPYYEGDRLWARETWANPQCDGPVYFADLTPEQQAEHKRIRRICGRLDVGDRWRVSIHMPRWASRLTLTVTDVRVQRLQEISADDAEAEGLFYAKSGPAAGFWFDSPEGKAAWGDGSVECFQRLWGSLHGPDAWAANPWVAALTFTVAKRNIDQMESAA